MRFDWSTLALQTVNFAILVWLLHRFLYKPVLAMIDTRKAEVQRQLDAAKELDAKAKSQLAALEEQRGRIAAEREAALQAAATQAQAIVEARRLQAERDAQALMDSTRKTLAAERERALDEARRLALDLGADFARRLLAEVPMQYRAEAWIERIEKHLTQLPQADRDALARQLGDGKALTVVTAAALPPATVQSWTDRLKRILGAGGTVAFEADAELIAGAELHFPTAILRFSWQSVLSSARTEMSLHADTR
jgi:F-type H+-transporting ATPase subunit b